MKLHLTYLLLANLAAIALAAPPRASTLAYSNNSTVNRSSSNIGLGDIVVSYNDLMSGPEPENRFAQPSALATGSDNDHDNGHYGLIVRVSSVKQHVGEMKGQRLFDIVEDALKKMCPFERGRVGCYEGMPDAYEPKGDNSPKEGHQFYSKYWVKDIPYKDSNGNYAHNAWLTLTLNGAMYRNRQYPGLGAATYEMIAGVYARATEFWENCYIEDFNRPSRPYKFCNVPKHVMVALPVHEGQTIQSWASLNLEFKAGRTEYGEFACSDFTSSVQSFWKSNVLPDVAKSLGTSQDDWKPACIQCIGTDDAFDLHKWRESDFSGACSYLGYQM